MLIICFFILLIFICNLFSNEIVEDEFIVVTIRLFDIMKLVFFLISLILVEFEVIIGVNFVIFLLFLSIFFLMVLESLLLL